MPNAEAVEVAKPSVVRVETSRGHGSGTVVSDHAILTNAHVVERATRVNVVNHLGDRFTGQVVWRSASMDLAVIRVAPDQLKPIQVGRIDDVRAGNEVIALGHPFGLDFTATKGIVSARDRELKGMHFIQVDAAINPGCSGGPLLDGSGRLIGLNTFLAAGADSIGFAIPVDRALGAARTAVEGCEDEAAACCPACGADVLGDSRFCAICGSRLHPILAAREGLMDFSAMLVSQPAASGVVAPVAGAVAAAVHVRQMVGMLLDSLGVDSFESRVSKDRWEFEYDAQRMEIGLMAEEGRLDRPMLYMRVIVGRLPNQGVMPLYRHLLETNDRLVGLPAFCVDPQNTVWMSTSRPIEGLDAVEMRDLLSRTHEMARRYSEELASEFEVIAGT